MYDIFLKFSAKVERLPKMYKCELMDSPIIAIGKVEALKTLCMYMCLCIKLLRLDKV